MPIIRTIAALLLSVLLISDATARFPRGAATGFNGGRSQTGISYPQAGNEFPFINFMKSAQGWTCGSDVPNPDELNADGYPLTSASGTCWTGGNFGMSTSTWTPTQAERPGNYVLKWTGNGTLTLGSLNGTVTPVSGSLTSSGGSGRYVVSTTGYNFTPGIASVGSPIISDIRLVHADDEALLDAGAVFGVKLKEKLVEANFGAIRFLDLQFANYTNVTTYSTRKPVSYVFYQGDEYRASLWAGITTNVGVAYSSSATPSGWAGLVDKATVSVKWNVSASSDATTLAVAGTAAKPVRDQTGSATSTNNNNRAVAGKISTLVYDATLDCWLKFGGDVAYQSVGLTNGVPTEIMLQLANEVRAHSYWVTPYLSIDPATDYMPSLMTYVRDNGISGTIPRFEGPNEDWNSLFFVTGYANNKAQAYWGIGNGFHEWHGKAVSILGQMGSAVFSGNRSRYQILLGVQTASGASGGTSGSDARQTAAQFVASGPAQSALTGSWGTINFTQSAASGWATHVALAQYISPSMMYKLAELTNGYAYVVTNAGNPTAQQTIADTYADTLAGASDLYNLSYMNTLYVAWCNWATTYSQGCTGYEGDYSPDYNGSNWSSTISGATATNPCVLTLADTSNARYNGGSALSGNAAVAGMSLTVSGLGGTLGTLLNGNTYTVQSGVSGNSVPIGVNCSAASYSTAGTATYVNSALYTNTLRYAGKYGTNLGTYTTTNMNNFAAAGGTFPANLVVGGTSTGLTRTDPIGTVGGGVWGIFDPSVYAATPSPQWGAIVTFNH